MSDTANTDQQPEVSTLQRAILAVKASEEWLRENRDREKTEQELDDIYAYFNYMESVTE